MNSEKILVTTFSGISEHPICSNVALLALRSRALHKMKQQSRFNASAQKEGREMSAFTMTKLIHTLRARLGYIIAHRTRPKPNNGRHGPHFNFPIWQGERLEVQARLYSKLKLRLKQKLLASTVELMGGLIGPVMVPADIEVS